MTVRSTFRKAKIAIPAAIAISLVGYACYMEYTAPPPIPTQHLSQADASLECGTGSALGEEVRHENGGDFHFYRCYASNQIVAANQ